MSPRVGLCPREHDVASDDIVFGALHSQSLAARQRADARPQLDHPHCVGNDIPFPIRDRVGSVHKVDPARVKGKVVD